MDTGEGDRASEGTDAWEVDVARMEGVEVDATRLPGCRGPVAIAAVVGGAVAAVVVGAVAAATAFHLPIA